MSVGSFFKSIESAFARLFKVTAWEPKVMSVINYSAPLVEGILAIVDPALAPLITGIINTVKSELATAYATLQQGTAPAGSSVAAEVTTALNSVKTNLSGLLQIAEVKNSGKIAEITSIVDMVNGEVDAALGTVPAAA